MKKLLSIPVMVLSIACFMTSSCDSDDGIENEVVIDMSEITFQLWVNSSTELIAKEAMPSWLAEKTSELEKDVPPMAIYKIYQCSWRSQTFYYIYHNFSSCKLCETYYADGKKVEWKETADAEDFYNNSSCWKCIYVMSNTPTNQLLILSDDDKQGSGIVINPKCNMVDENRLDGDTVRIIHHINFKCDIQNSPIFDGLWLDFEDSPFEDFDILKKGDTFDTNQFYALAECHRSWTEKYIKMIKSQSGVIEVIDKKIIDGKSFITISLHDIKFHDSDKSCLYIIDGTIDFEILDFEENDKTELENL